MKIGDKVKIVKCEDTPELVGMEGEIIYDADSPFGLQEFDWMVRISSTRDEILFSKSELEVIK